MLTSLISGTLAFASNEGIGGKIAYWITPDDGLYMEHVRDYLKDYERCLPRSNFSASNPVMKQYGLVEVTKVRLQEGRLSWTENEGKAVSVNGVRVLPLPLREVLCSEANRLPGCLHFGYAFENKPEKRVIEAKYRLNAQAEGHMAHWLGLKAQPEEGEHDSAYWERFGEAFCKQLFPDEVGQATFTRVQMGQALSWCKETASDWVTYVIQLEADAGKPMHLLFSNTLGFEYSPVNEYVRELEVWSPERVDLQGFHWDYFADVWGTFDLKKIGNTFEAYPVYEKKYIEVATNILLDWVKFGGDVYSFSGASPREIEEIKVSLCNFDREIDEVIEMWADQLREATTSEEVEKLNIGLRTFRTLKELFLERKALELQVFGEPAPRVTEFAASNAIFDEEVSVRTVKDIV